MHKINRASSTTFAHVRKEIEDYGYTVGKDIGLANNPEFLREGHAVDDFLTPDRIIIGVSDNRTQKIMEKLYDSFNVSIHILNLNTAEYVKYLSNNLLATLISFANEQSMIARAIGDIDIQKAFSVLIQDKRWFGTPANMTTYVWPGCGFGGYCLPKDVIAMKFQSQSFGYEASLLKEVLSINDRIMPHLTDVFIKSVSTDSRITILGLAFKPGSDDVRSSPAAKLIMLLGERGYNLLTAYDPMAADSFQSLYGFDINYADTMEEAVSDSDAVVLITAWPEFAEKASLLKKRIVFDFRYFLTNED